MPTAKTVVVDPCPQAILNLVQRFDLHRDTYQRDTYNETQVRREFIDPLFAALGWDVDNTAGHAEAYKDVIHEDAIKVGGVTKAPDYCFRIGGTRKFFVEAKKPAVAVGDDPGPAYQLRRYAWSNKLPLSIVTDFEEFAVYDCRIKPNPDDKPSTARVLYLKCDEYGKRWGEIAAIFSKDAILKGSFDKYAESNKRKRGTVEVDDAFLEEIETWRDELARNIALRNPNLSVRDLNYAVGKTIDRIIFLRMCEDRGVETYAQLQTLLSGPKVYRRLVEFFYRADERYNSGLFHFEPERDRSDPPDNLTPSLVIDDKVLKDIIKKLYYPECPYEFSVMPSEILGQVYEQFLGKVITLTAGHRAKVEYKPEVKKAGGVYYTPKYIVDYIVEHTVGKLLADCKSPADAAELRVLDPACGSGSFLLGAYQTLLDWHLKWYCENDPEKWAKKKTPPIYESPARGQYRDREAAGIPRDQYRDRKGAGNWCLTITEKKRILLANIYGVDIDPQAVEVTKLSLLLKVLEGENAETVGHTLRLFHERALPDLGANIKCGNSLIGPDFYDNQQLSLLDDDDERYRINAFDWEREFPDTMRRSGFDAVIGNPPWGQKEIDKDSWISGYLRERYGSLRGIFDLFRPFVEKGIALTRSGALFGMVLPDIVLLKDYEETRRHVLDRLAINRIDWWGMAFRDAVIDAATIVARKSAATANQTIVAVIHNRDGTLVNHIPQARFRQNERLTFNLFLTDEKRRILERLDRWPKLGEHFEIHEGVHSGNIRDDLFVARKLDKTCREFLFGRDEIRPYVLRWNGKYIRLGTMPERRTRERYANAGQPRWYDREKLLVRRTGDYVMAAVDSEQRYASNNFFLVFPITPVDLDLYGLCALLNSRLMTWYFRTIEPRTGRVFAELKIKHLRTFPLPLAQQSDTCAILNQLGRQRTDAGRRALESKTPHAIELARRNCAALDERIDGLVLSAYELQEPHREHIAQEESNAKQEESVA